LQHQKELIMTDVKVSFYLKRNEGKADGTAPVLGRIRIGKSMAQFSARVDVPVSLWDTKSGRAVGKSKTAMTVNTALNRISVAVHSAYRELSARNKSVSALDVKHAFQGIASRQETLVGRYEAHNEQFLKRAGVDRVPDTCKRYGVSLAHLKRFMRKRYNVGDMSFGALTPAFVADYDHYLRVELRFAPKTTVGIVSHLHRIVKMALADGLIRHDPFIGYEYVSPPPVPKSLTAEELKKLMKAKLSRPNMNFIRDMFIFSAFTGISFSDMRALTEENLSTADDGVRWVHLKRKKTGTPCHIPLLDIPLRLIDKYRGIAKDGRLFPMLCCSKTNRLLKRIAVECSIDRRVTFHQARHCYASQICLSQGVPLETVGELLGHRDWRATRR
jgi:integrase